MTTPAVACAAAICWLARQPGLPKGALRFAVVSRHPVACDWCDWTSADLLRMVSEIEPHVGFSRLPTHEQRRLVAEAQGLVAV